MATARDTPEPTGTNRRHLLLGALAVQSMVRPAAYVRAFAPRHDPATGATRSRSYRPRGVNGDAIQDAVDRAHRAGGGVVELAVETYATDAPIVLKDNVRLAGAGSSMSVKAAPPSCSTPVPTAVTRSSGPTERTT